MATNAMSKTMTRFWMESKISEDSRWHSKHKGDFRTEDQLADHFVGKLRDQCRHEKSEVAIMVRFTRMLKEQLESYESQTNLLLKLADTGRVAVLLHKHIDIALDTLDIMEPAKREKWHDQLLRERRKRLKVFKKFVKEDEKVKAALGDNNQQLEIVTLLRYCVEKYGLVKAADENEQYRDKLMEAELDTIAAVYELVVQKAGIVSSKLPDWFVTSEHQWAWVNKAKLEDSKETWDSRAREKFIDENLGEEVHGEVCEEVCVRLASIWTELNHPHLRKFYAKSEEIMTTGAVRWKAPECLKDERPSFASDIYAFGLCIIEAVTGEYPWVGIVEEDSVVEQNVKDGKMHPRPPGFEDNEWKLVEQMCRSSPQERIGIGAVIKILEDIGVIKLMTTAGMIGPTTVDRKTLT
ncbi:TKL protein kinase [Phytophthora cinnamomi]|uniref:TKL protein kinase n=1 Tax=Phytophthora cinnamomi TaxID=4785 RepID=UPI00355A4B76|nr:TKL protein kinase [Phytophthora cinnamomi]